MRLENFLMPFAYKEQNMVCILDKSDNGIVMTMEQVILNYGNADIIKCYTKSVINPHKSVAIEIKIDKWKL